MQKDKFYCNYNKTQKKKKNYKTGMTQSKYDCNFNDQINKKVVIFML